MQDMLLSYSAASSWAEDARPKYMLESMGIYDALEAEGQYMAAAPRHAVTTATSVRVCDGKRQVTEG
jgi:hypothetical protein